MIRKELLQKIRSVRKKNKRNGEYKRSTFVLETFFSLIRLLVKNVKYLYIKTQAVKYN